jgi:hypothetical protein
MKTLKDILPLPNLHEARMIGKTGMSIYKEGLREELKQAAIELWWSYSINDKVTRDCIKNFFNLTEEDLK